MEIGRRKFLKFLGLATAGVVVDPLATIIENNTYYINRRLGFGFNIPQGWEIEAFGDFEVMCDKQFLSGFSEELSKELVNELSDGLVTVIKKYPSSLKINQFSPSITFFMSPDDILEEFDTFEDFVGRAIDGFSLVLTGYDVTIPPKAFVGKGFEAFTFKSRYLFEHKDISGVLIDDEVWIIHHNGLIYTIHMYDTPYDGDDTQVEFEQFKSSLHIA